jgi:hypothetical protein
VQFLGGDQTTAIDFIGDDRGAPPFGRYVLLALGPENPIQGAGGRLGQGMFSAPRYGTAVG